jgi:hypothetical protein
LQDPTNREGREFELATAKSDDQGKMTGEGGGDWETMRGPEFILKPKARGERETEESHAIRGERTLTCP